jgi:hypothetical protein
MTGSVASGATPDCESASATCHAQRRLVCLLLLLLLPLTFQVKVPEK